MLTNIHGYKGVRGVDTPCRPSGGLTPQEGSENQTPPAGGPKNYVSSVLDTWILECMSSLGNDGTMVLGYEA